MSEINSIKVRMYRHGFGDCFLLRYFNQEDELVFRMLIDCGLKHNDKVIGVELSKVVDDIRDQVSVDGTPRLDVLVITHEHWDHVSGFKPERAFFDDFEIDKIWLAWTENPKDTIAQQINNRMKLGVAALSIASERLAANHKSKTKKAAFGKMYYGDQMLRVREVFHEGVQDILGFFGPLAATKVTKSGISIKNNFTISVGTEKALNHVKRELSKKASSIKYFKPGQLIEDTSVLPGIRMYVLGPPRDERINKDTPSRGAGKEVYFGFEKNGLFGFLKGVLNSAGIAANGDDGRPFSTQHAIPPAKAKSDPYFKSTYFAPDKEHQLIEDDWLDMTGALALQMDNDTNNTSLVLAIEFTATGKVLLFPADAQVGNWLSWHDYEWEVKVKGKTRKVDATDLLKRTVFYKAGHHASHNATLKELGLELMENEDLVVFVPEKNGQYSGIPHPELVERLNEKAKGRVVFSADVNYPANNVKKKKPAALSAEEWKKFKDNLDVKKLYVEYTVR